MKKTKKATYSNHTFSLGKTVYFVGLGGQEAANLGPRFAQRAKRAKRRQQRPKMDQKGRRNYKMSKRDQHGGIKLL